MDSSRNGVSSNIFDVTSSLTVSPRLSILSIKAPESPVPDMALATSEPFSLSLIRVLTFTVSTVGSAVMIVFGTQRDVLRTWFGWLRLIRMRMSSGNGDDSRSSTPNSLTFADPNRSTPTQLKRSSSWVDKTSLSEVSSMYSGQLGPSNQNQNKRELKKSLSRRDISQPVVRQDLTLEFPELERIEIGQAV